MPKASNWSPPPEWFERWWSGPDLIASIDRESKRLPYAEAMVRPGFAAYREAYTAGELARIVGTNYACEVRLSAAEFPDFQMRLADKVIDFEATEADTIGRRRGDEYRKIRAMLDSGEQPPVEEDPDDGFASALAAIEQRLHLKSGKRYGASVHLAVLVNFNSWGCPPTDRIEAISLPYLAAFEAVWYVWGDHVVRIDASYGDLHNTRKTIRLATPLGRLKSWTKTSPDT